MHRAASLPNRLATLASDLDEIGKHDLADRLDGMIRNAGFLSSVGKFIPEMMEGLGRWGKGGRMFETLRPTLKGLPAGVGEELKNLPPAVLQRGNAQEIYRHISGLNVGRMGGSGGTPRQLRFPAFEQYPRSGSQETFSYPKTWEHLMRGQRRIEGMPSTFPLEPGEGKMMTDVPGNIGDFQTALNSNMVRDPSSWGRYGPGVMATGGALAVGVPAGASALGGRNEGPSNQPQTMYQPRPMTDKMRQDLQMLGAA